jgi:hypothetical protein
MISKKLSGMTQTAPRDSIDVVSANSTQRGIKKLYKTSKQLRKSR